jgi:hypothetical protein
MCGHIECMGEWRGVYRVLVGKPEGRSSLGSPKCRWEDNMMDLQDVGYEGMNCIEVAQVGTGVGHW